MSIEDFRVQPNQTDPGCPSEQRTLAWLDGQLAAGEAADAERHVASCPECRETMAVFVGFAPDNLDEKEAELLEAVSERTAAAAIALGHDERRSRATSERFGWTRPLAIAAAIVAIAGTVFAVWLVRSSGSESLVRGERLLAQATSSSRPTTLRVTGQSYAPVRVTRGLDSENAERLEAARAIFAAAVEADPSPNARHALGRALLASGDASRAIVELGAASAASPNDAAILSDLAVARSIAGDAGGARSDLDRALAIEPRRAEALFNRAVIRAMAGDAAGAREDLERLRSADPASGWLAEAERLVEESLERKG